MSFRPRSTADLDEVGGQKTLLYAHHGWGKTWQARNYQRRYGPGFIISGEAGLRSLKFESIDYLPFDSFGNPTDPNPPESSFLGICRLMQTPEFKDQGYRWIMLDSLTELSDRLIAEIEDRHKTKPKKNGFEVWGEYARLMIGACKWFRDQPYHVLVTALAREEAEENGGTDYWPAVKGSAVQKQIPGIFDNVFCGVKVTQTDDKSNPRISRLIVTDEYRGWHGKARDPRRRLRAVEKADDITMLLERIVMPDSEHEKLLAAAAKPAADEAA